MSEIPSDITQTRKRVRPEARFPRRLFLKSIVLGAAALAAKEVIPRIPKESPDIAQATDHPTKLPQTEGDSTFRNESIVNQSEVRDVISGLLDQLWEPRDWQEDDDGNIPDALLTVCATEPITKNGPTRTSNIIYMTNGHDLIIQADQGRGDDELQEQQANISMSITVPGIGKRVTPENLPHSFAELRDFLSVMGERPEGIRVGTVSAGYVENGEWTEAYIESRTEKAEEFNVADNFGRSKLGYFNIRVEKTLRLINGEDLLPSA